MIHFAESLFLVFAVVFALLFVVFFSADIWVGWKILAVLAVLAVNIFSVDDEKRLPK